MVDQKGLKLTKMQWEQMQTHAASQAPEEACGLLAGAAGQVEMVLPVTNVLHSPVRFRMEPKEQLDAFLRMEQDGWDLIAIYHSHPAGPAAPSPTDIAEAYYPEAIHIIWSSSAGEWTCRGYLIREGQVTEVSLLIVKSG